MSRDDKAFARDIPDVYETLLVPMLFASYADDLAQRTKQLQPTDVLELAAGTGVVTRELAKQTTAKIVATDLNPDMLAQAEAKGTVREVERRPADALALPFPDGGFDVVLCQFGVMFFPDKPKAYAEARRVLRPGGTFLFNVWDTLATNDFADAVHAVSGGGFLGRTPYAYNDEQQIRDDLRAGGFEAEPSFETLTRTSPADSAADVARAFCAGTPLANELGDRVEDAIDAATREVERRGLDAKMQALVVSVKRDAR